MGLEPTTLSLGS